jgi:hypothetical protein
LPDKCLDDILSIPVDRLAEIGKVRVEIVPDLDALCLWLWLLWTRFGPVSRYTWDRKRSCAGAGIPATSCLGVVTSGMGFLTMFSISLY